MKTLKFYLKTVLGQVFKIFLLHQLYGNFFELEEFVLFWFRKKCHNIPVLGYINVFMNQIEQFVPTFFWWPRLFCSDYFGVGVVGPFAFIDTIFDHDENCEKYV